MATNEEYLDNLLKAFEEEEKEREGDGIDSQEKTIITDNDDYIQSLLDEVQGMLDDTTDEETTESVPEDNADLMDMLGAETEQTIADDDANNNDELMSLLNTSEDDLLKMLQAESMNAEGDSIGSDLLENNADNEWESDLDELLATAVDKMDDNQEIAEETTIDAFSSEDMDITQLFGGMENSDENVELFAEPEQEEAIKELTKEEAPKKKHLLSWKKKNADAESVSEDTVEKKVKDKKEPGALGQFFKALLEDEEEENTEGNADAPADENDELLKQLEEEGKKGKKKKEKKEKKEKKKKDKKGKQQASEEGAEDNIGGDEEDGKAKKKKKKREKKRKEKTEETSLVSERSKKVLSKKSFMVLIAFCASVIAIIVCLSAFIPDYVEKKQAREAFYHGDYETAHVLLYGKNLNESDKLILERVTVVLQLERKLEAYYFHEESGKKAEALDALMQGISYYQELPDKNVYGAGDELQLSYQKVLEILNQKYDVDEAKALEIIACDDIRYSQWIYSVAEGLEFDIPKEEQVEQEAEQEGPQDILPEEEDIIKTETEN